MEEFCKLLSTSNQSDVRVSVVQLIGQKETTMFFIPVDAGRCFSLKKYILNKNYGSW